jgi:hypothetical protein
MDSIRGWVVCTNKGRHLESSILLQNITETEQTHENQSLYNLYCGSVWNRVPAKYKSEVLLLCQLCRKFWLQHFILFIRLFLPLLKTYISDVCTGSLLLKPALNVGKSFYQLGYISMAHMSLCLFAHEMWSQAVEWYNDTHIHTEGIPASKRGFSGTKRMYCVVSCCAVNWTI